MFTKETQQVYRTERGDVRIGHIAVMRISGNRVLYSFRFPRDVPNRDIIRSDSRESLINRLRESYGIELMDQEVG